jgi:hypothetical protein
MSWRYLSGLFWYQVRADGKSLSSYGHTVSFETGCKQHLDEQAGRRRVFKTNFDPPLLRKSNLILTPI